MTSKAVTDAKALIAKEKFSDDWQPKLLNALMDNALTITAADSLANTINNFPALYATNYGGNVRLAKLHSLATFYFFTIVAVMRTDGTRDWISIFRSPYKKDVASMADPTPATRSGNLRELILIRDDYRCCLTKRVEPAVYDDVNAKPAAMPAPTDLYEVAEAAHIIPFSLNKYDNTATDIKKQKHILKALESFAGTSFAALDGQGINNVQNVLALSKTAHRYFGELKLAFEATTTLNQYKPVGYGTAGKVFKNAANVTLKDSSGNYTGATATAIPLPELLRYHAALCKVVHAAGLAEMLDQLFKDHDPADPVVAKYIQWVKAADQEVLNPSSVPSDPDKDIGDQMLHTLIPTHA